MYPNFVATEHEDTLIPLLHSKVRLSKTKNQKLKHIKLSIATKNNTDAYHDV